MQPTFTEAYGAAFERAVVWLLLHDPEYAQTIYASADAGLFESAIYQTIFDAGRVVSEASGAPVSISVIGAELSRLRGTVKQQTTAHTAYSDALKKLIALRRASPYGDADLRYIKNATAKFLTKAKVREALLTAGDHWQKDEFDKILEVVESAVHSSARASDTSLGIDYSKPIDRVKMYSAVRMAVKQSPVGVPILDKLLRGGLEPGALGMVFAPAKRGKSLMLVQIGCEALALGLNVACVSLELSDVDYAMRYDAHFTGVPINEIAANPRKHARSILMSNMKKVKGRLFINHYGPDTTSVGDIYVWLKRLRALHGFVPDVILLDYLDLLRHTSRKRDAPDMGATARALRQLGNDMDACTWSASQTNRGSYHGKRVTLEDAAEDIQKVHVADVIIGWAQTPQEKERGRARLQLLANRQGGHEGATVDCVVTTDTMTCAQARTQATSMRTIAGLPSTP